MELRYYIDKGITATGSLTALSKALDTTQPRMSKYRNNAEAMPLEICVKLAKIIGQDPFAVIAAARYAAEKQEAKKEFWRPFVEHARAATAVLTLGLVTSFVTPNHAQAAPTLDVASKTICIM